MSYELSTEETILAMCFCMHLQMAGRVKKCGCGCVITDGSRDIHWIAVYTATGLNSTVNNFIPFRTVQDLLRPAQSLPYIRVSRHLLTSSPRFNQAAAGAIR